MSKLLSLLCLLSTVASANSIPVDPTKWAGALRISSGFNGSYTGNTSFTGNHTQTGNLVVTGTTNPQGAVTMGSTGTFAGLFFSCATDLGCHFGRLTSDTGGGARTNLVGSLIDLAATTRVTWGASSSNTYSGTIANSGTNAAHIMKNTVTLSGTTRIVEFHNDNTAATAESYILASDGSFTGPVTIGATGTNIADSYAASSSIDWAGVTAGCEDSSAITVTGAAVNDVCSVGPPAALPSTTSHFMCWVSTADAVTVRHCSIGASGNPAAATYTVRVFDP